MHNIAIFASGEGTNAENIIRYFQEKKTAHVAVVIYNKQNAGVRLRAERLGVPALYRTRADIADEAQMNPLLEQYEVSAIVLAGFLLLVPAYLIHRYEGRIVNIHPALMPKHCGKGMYGSRVHEEVVAQGDRETGITIHLVDEQFDHGQILFQAHCPVLPGDTPEEVAQRVHKLEYAHFPHVIEELLTGKTAE